MCHSCRGTGAAAAPPRSRRDPLNRRHPAKVGPTSHQALPTRGESRATGGEHGVASDVTSDDVVHASASPQPISGRRCRAGDPPTGHARHPEVGSAGDAARSCSACATARFRRGMAGRPPGTAPTDRRDRRYSCRRAMCRASIESLCRANPVSCAFTTPKPTRSFLCIRPHSRSIGLRCGHRTE